MNYESGNRNEHLHTLALMNELDHAQHSDLEEDVRYHIQEAVRHLDVIHDHLDETLDMAQTSGVKRDVEKARDHISIALNLAIEAVNMPAAKMRAALQECRDHVEIANRQMSRAGMDAVI